MEWRCTVREGLDQRARSIVVQRLGRERRLCVVRARGSLAEAVLLQLSGSSGALVVSQVVKRASSGV